MVIVCRGASGGGVPNLVTCTLSNETFSDSDTFYFVNSSFEVESISVPRYESKNVEIPVGTIFCYYYQTSAITTSFSGGAQRLAGGIYEVTGDFSVRIWQ